MSFVAICEKVRFELLGYIMTTQKLDALGDQTILLLPADPAKWTGGKRPIFRTRAKKIVDFVRLRTCRAHGYQHKEG